MSVRGEKDQNLKNRSFVRLVRDESEKLRPQTNISNVIFYQVYFDEIEPFRWLKKRMNIHSVLLSLYRRALKVYQYKSDMMHAWSEYFPITIRIYFLNGVRIIIIPFYFSFRPRTWLIVKLCRARSGRHGVFPLVFNDPSATRFFRTTVRVQYRLDIKRFERHGKTFR